ncbi:MAG: TlpA disulfide reductase family protein [Acidobacteriota bacterium]
MKTTRSFLSTCFLANLLDPRAALILGLLLGPFAAAPSTLASATEAPLGVGDGLPDFKVLDASGVPVAGTTVTEGRVLLLDFWASWCFPCRFTLPELDRLQEDFAGRGDFSVVGLSLDEGVRNRRRAEKMAGSISYPVYFDTSSKPLKPQLGVAGIPVLFLIDADGRIVRRWDGEPDFTEVRAALVELLGPASDAADE